MATKADFTPEEWANLRNGVHGTAFLIMMAGQSGITGSLAEAFAAGHALVEGARDDNALVAALSTREEAAVSQDEVKKFVSFGRKPDEMVRDTKNLAFGALDAALATLAAKDPADLAAYKDYVMATAFKIANAAKEGSFLGFGGERISDGEEAVLEELSGKLGLPIPTA
jgi:hypothetical protein